MGSFTCAASCHPIRCFAGKDGPDLDKQNLTNVKINGNISKSWAESSKALSQVSRVATLSSTPSVAQNGHIAEQQVWQNIPTKKQFVDTHRQGVIIEGSVGYHQTVVICSYKVGPDKTVTVESILNLFQETALNHVWMSGLMSNGFGATHGMKKNNLIWVVSRLHVKVDHYPIWGEVVEIDTWVGALGKNNLQGILTSPSLMESQRKRIFSEEERHGRKDSLPAILIQLKNFKTHAKRLSPKQPHVCDID